MLRKVRSDAKKKKKKDIAVSTACNNNSSQWKSQMGNISFVPENNLVLQDCLETTPPLVLKEQYNYE